MEVGFPSSKGQSVHGKLDERDGRRHFVEPKLRQEEEEDHDDKMSA
jgi:hypothetical protein